MAIPHGNHRMHPQHENGGKMEIVKRLFKEETGQTATEYMVLLASVVAVILGVAFTFKDNFSKGVKTMSSNVQTNLAAGFK